MFWGSLLPQFQNLADFSYKGPGNKYFGLCQPRGLCFYRVKAAMDNTSRCMWLCYKNSSRPFGLWALVYPCPLYCFFSNLIFFRLVSTVNRAIQDGARCLFILLGTSLSSSGELWFLFFFAHELASCNRLKGKGVCVCISFRMYLRPFRSFSVHVF